MTNQEQRARHASFQGQAPVASETSSLSKAINVCSYSFTGNHLVEISLMYELQEHSRKNHYFCFVKLLPGSGTGNNRTFLSDKHISMKLGCEKLLEFAKALRAHASGSALHLGNYKTFTDTSKAKSTSANSNAGQKQLWLCFGEKIANGEKISDITQISLGLTIKGTVARTDVFKMTPYYASSMADVVEKIAKKGMDLEINRQIECAREMAAQAHKSH